ncbi:hypothetical protein ACWDUL_05135 [Nocardia niigatensis]|uniref:hypothetical protein n=1 Tax=Nocardia niigatensis TaxID=209249 RepID=UPI0012F6624D|nr:hypothetical protein [Nocardia niigatensis]
MAGAVAKPSGVLQFQRWFELFKRLVLRKKGAPVMPNQSVAHLVADVVARYGSLDAFCARLRGSVENPTEELRRITGECGPQAVTDRTRAGSPAAADSARHRGTV